METEESSAGFLVVHSDRGAEYDPAMPQDERRAAGVYARWAPTLQEARAMAVYWVADAMLINAAIETDDPEEQMKLLSEHLPERVSETATNLTGLNTSYTYWGTHWIGLFEGTPSDNNWGQVEGNAAVA